MENKLAVRIHLIARYTLASIFIYHGLVPKILWLSPAEVLITNSHHLDAALVAPMAGIFEILLGLSVVLFRKSLMPIYTSMVLLAALLLDVMLVVPSLLVEAFNPVTINLAAMVLAYFAFITQDQFIDSKGY